MANPKKKITYEYGWGFQGEQPLEYTVDGIVTAVHWELVCTSSDKYSERAYGCVQLDPPKQAPVPLNDLTKAQVLGWVKTQMGSNMVTQREEDLKEKIEIQRQPRSLYGAPKSWKLSNL